MRPIWWYVMTAIGAAAFWWAVASVCFSLAGAGPLDVLRGDATGSARAAVAALMLAGVAVFAVLTRAAARRTGRHGG